MKAHTYRKWSLLILSILMTGMFQLQAQNERDYRWKMQNNRGDRYEGRYTTLSPNRDLTLVAYYAGVTPYKFNAGQKLSIHFYSPYEAPAYLKAEEMRIRSRYWMETKEGIAYQRWNSYKNWQVDSYLREGGVTADNLGLVARIKFGSSYREHYLPVILNMADKPHRITKYQVYFRNSFHLEKGAVKIYPGLFPGNQLSNKQQLGDPIWISEKVAGEGFSFPMDPNQLGAHIGWITVQIIYKKWGDPVIYKETYSLYHPGWFM